MKDYFSSLIWSSRPSLPRFSLCLARSPLPPLSHSHLDQRQTRKIKQINSDALDNIPLRLTRPCDLWDTLAEVVTLVEMALSVRGASVCWFGLHVPTCRKIYKKTKKPCPVPFRQHYISTHPETLERPVAAASCYLQYITMNSLYTLGIKFGNAQIVVSLCLLSFNQKKILLLIL